MQGHPASADVPLGRQMHKCTFSALAPKRLPRKVPRKCRQNVKLPGCKLGPNQPGIRPFSTSTVCSSNASQAELATTRHKALTVQHKIENLLEPTFEVGERPSDLPRTAGAVAFWRDVLSDTFENLSTAAERPARVAGTVQFPRFCDKTHDDLRSPWCR